MPLVDIVNVSISTQSAGVAQAGFGVPLILSHSADWVERVRFYSSPAGVAADGFDSTTPEYKAATAYFAQNPAPPRIALGRAVNKPTQAFTVTVSLVKNSTAYKIRIGADTFSITSDASATNDEIVAALQAAITTAGITAANPGSSGSKTLTLTANTAGAWFDVEIIDVSLLSIAQDHAAPDLSADLTAIKNENDSWYELQTNFNSKAYIAAAALWVEANEKGYLARSQDTAIITHAKAGGSDIAWTLQNSAYARSAIVYHPATGAMVDAAWGGVCLPMDPGSETWKFKTLATIPAYTLTATHQTNLEDKNANYYYTVADVNITAQGKVAAGEFIDVIRFRDWLKARMQERIYARLINAKKIAFTDAGIAIIEAEVRGQLQDGVNIGGLTDNPAPTVSVPKASAVSTADKTARRLTGVTFKATLAGAIHSLTISGVISV